MVMAGATGKEAYAYNDRHFREACKVILGGEVGALSEYEQWLLSLKQPMGHANSTLHGAPIVLASEDYSPSARFIALGEESSLAAKPFSINDIKDIDSLFAAARESFAYSGNIVLGNSQFVGQSSDVSDSFYIYKSARVSGCKSIACSTIIKDANYLFGCNVGSKDEWCMRCHQFSLDARCFEANFCTSSSGCYYVYDCLGCKDAMFSFGQRNGTCMIGNLPLPKDKYLSLKASLLAQMRAELMAKKKLPSLQDIFCEAARTPMQLTPEMSKCAKKFERKASRAPMQKAFDSTCGIVLGAPAGELSRCKCWLLRKNIKIRGGGSPPLAAGKSLRHHMRTSRRSPPRAMSILTRQRRLRPFCASPEQKRAASRFQAQAGCFRASFSSPRSSTRAPSSTCKDAQSYCGHQTARKCMAACS